MNIPRATDVLIAGGGPAGALLGCLLARRGVQVLVVEKQSDFERDFRGETVAASSVVMLRQLGFGPALDRHGFLETESVSIRLEGRLAFSVDYRRFPIGVLPMDIPQPALIGILHAASRDLPGFQYAADTAVAGLVESDGAVRGAVLKQKDGTRVEVAARLVVGADGRFSKVRKAAGLAATITPMERDFLSFKLPRPPEWGRRAELVVERDRHLVVLPTYPDFLRVGHNLPKRGLGALRFAGFDKFKDGMAAIDPRLAPLLRDFLHTWDDTGFLEIFTAELEQWSRDGVILIGDASHTVTPILGQGVNLALQDAVSVAPLIARALAAATPVVPAVTFAEFVATRRAQKAAVTAFQRIQEASLAASSRSAVFQRRLKMRALHVLPTKYRMFDKVLNVRHPVDPVDRELAGSSPAQVG